MKFLLCALVLFGCAGTQVRPYASDDVKLTISCPEQLASPSLPVPLGYPATARAPRVTLFAVTVHNGLDHAIRASVRCRQVGRGHEDDAWSDTVAVVAAHQERDLTMSTLADPYGFPQSLSCTLGEVSADFEDAASN